MITSGIVWSILGNLYSLGNLLNLPYILDILIEIIQIWARTDYGIEEGQDLAYLLALYRMHSRDRRDEGEVARWVDP